MIAIRHFGTTGPVETPLTEGEAPDEWDRSEWGVGGPTMTREKYCQIVWGVKKWKLTFNRFERGWDDDAEEWVWKDNEYTAYLMDSEIDPNAGGDEETPLVDVLSVNARASFFHWGTVQIGWGDTEAHSSGGGYGFDYEANWPGFPFWTERIPDPELFGENFCTDGDGDLYGPFLIWIRDVNYPLGFAISNYGNRQQILDEGLPGFDVFDVDGEMHVLGEVFRIPLAYVAQEEPTLTPTYPDPGDLWLKLEPVEWWDYGGKINTTTGAPV